jgi:hypothetical protein
LDRYVDRRSVTQRLIQVLHVRVLNHFFKSDRNLDNTT